MRIILTFITIIFLSLGALAAPNFPALSARVVDEANILSKKTVQNLEQILVDYENGTGNQIVVVTISSLQDLPIEDYGYQLGRAWQIGQKDKNTGALLIVAPNEKKVRIEVGYGLEPILTDAAASKIINSIILPNFRNGDLKKGIIQGTQAIIAVLGGESISDNEPHKEKLSGIQILFMLLFIFFFAWFAIKHPFLAMLILSNSSSRFGGSGSNRGFGGGGGNFGGGGSSGSW